MIITRTPYRISFAGGGTDLREFYSKDYGCVTSVSINKYMFITVHPYYDKNLIKASYSKVEIVNNANNIQHPLIREGLKMMDIKTGVELASIADIPSGTGLGSSSSYAVGLINALSALRGKHVSKEELAKRACDIEIEILKDPIGKQDQYAVSYGNLNFIKFNRDESVEIQPIICSRRTKENLQDNLLLFYTGITRRAGDVLKEQKENSDKKSDVLLKMRSLAEVVRDSLQNNDLASFGEALHKGWILKKQMASKVSNNIIDEYYDRGIKAGAIGGKLLGAGGGGYILFYCEHDKQESLRKNIGLEEVNFKFDAEGSKVVYFDESKLLEG